MASPQLAIAKVSFSAIILRQDPISCPRSEIDGFFSLLDATLSRCSPANVQQSKQWLLKYVVASPARIAALGKYLAALSKSFAADVATSRAARETSSRRKRLHVLYVLNDIIHHVTVRQRQDDFASNLEPFLPGLVEAAAGYPNSPKQIKKVLDIITLWSERDYFMPSFISQLETVAKEAPTSQASKTDTDGSSSAASAKLAKEVPFILPSMHGDPGVPWYDLPAANWLPIIEPNSSRPMNPSMIKPLQLVPGPADKALAKAVQDLLDSVDRIYGKDISSGEDPLEDIDQLGQRVVVDELTRDVLDGETYYGWSRNFCDKMKKRRKQPANGSSEDNRGRSYSRSRSRSSSRSSSRPAFKRRRTSDSPRSRGGSPARRRSYSRERRARRSYSDSRSPSPRRFSRSPSPQRPSGLPSRPPFFDAPNNGSQPGQMPRPLPPQPNPGFPGFPATFPVPPPPPPNWTGPWPPPPPLPPAMGGGGPPQPWMPPGPPAWGDSAVPSPPPPPMGQNPYPNQGQGGGYQYGRGDGGYRGGRGGWRGGRGNW
ncbi:uncharacterized protein PG986_000357 [Apiospora aurea]|uniref:CID domain-containing protein n=1 Tax=Apiospora aurea TaxID=335848 RepID=A0ABR1QTV4_9PEZI